MRSGRPERNTSKHDYNALHNDGTTSPASSDMEEDNEVGGAIGGSPAILTGISQVDVGGAFVGHNQPSASYKSVILVAV